jgi:Fe-Mn family superoxide dismutase
MEAIVDRNASPITHELPDLPYPRDALEPHISRETLEYHHGKHHQKYVDTLNKLIENTVFAHATLEEIVRHACGGVFNNAAQHWNHTFYWNSMSPVGGGEPKGALADALEHTFGSIDGFRDRFTEAATANFGSGWVWLVQTDDGRLDIDSTDDADTPLAHPGRKPLLTCDVWEHAYYIDYRNAKPKYLAAFWNIVNWDFATSNLRS